MSESTDLVMIGYHCYLSKKWGDEVSREPMDGRLVVKPKNVIQIWRRDYVDSGWVVVINLAWITHFRFSTPTRCK